MKNTITLVILVLHLCISGCLPDTSGVTPPGDRLIYPTGLAITKDNSHLVVANSNFDLNYNSGTLVAIDLAQLDAIIEEIEGQLANGNYEYGPNLDSDEAFGSYLSKDRQHLFIPSQSPNLIKPESTLRIGSFASDLDITPSGERLVIPVRGERAVLLVDIDKNGKLQCGQGDDLKCDDRHRVRSTDYQTMPIEPYEVTTMEYLDGDQVVTFGFATHLAGGEVSMFVIDSRQKDAAQSRLWEDDKLIGVVDGVVPGASGIVANKSFKNEIYVSGRNDPLPSISVMKVLTDSENGSFTRNPYFADVATIDLARDMYGGTNARGLAVTEDGSQLFLVSRSPEALLQIDIQSRKLIDMTTVGTDPSVVSLFEKDGNVYAFVLCFLSDQVYIADVDTMEVQTRSTGSGPHAVTFDKERERAYISNFRESTITILEAVPPFNHLSIPVPDPRNPDKIVNAKIKIGKPRLPKGHS